MCNLCSCTAGAALSAGSGGVPPRSANPAGSFVNDFRALIAGDDFRHNDMTGNGTPVIVTYTFLTTGELPNPAREPFGASSFTAMSRADRSAVKQAMAEFTKRAGIQFVEVDTGGQLELYRANGAGNRSWAYYPSDNQPQDVVINNALGDVRRGRQGFDVVLHEIGHAVGLKHPFDGGPRLVPSLDLITNTVMSYTYNAPVIRTLGPLDRQALQHLYGAPSSDNGQILRWDEARDTLFVAGRNTAETILGTYAANVIDARGGNDRLFGRDYADRLIGGANDDTVRGGEGSDTLLGEAGSDALFGEDGDDRLYGGDNADTADGGTGNDFLSGGSGRDILIGQYGDDTLFGGLGPDTLRGEAGRDVAFGEAGPDVIVGAAGTDVLKGGPANDYLRGDAGRDRLFGDDGNDTLIGGDDGDWLVGGRNADRVMGGGHNDSLFGGHANDTLLGGLGHDLLDGADNNDALFGGDGRDTLYGGTRNDVLAGGNGHDRLHGGGGPDVLRGEAGNDEVFGEASDDVIRGDGGNDLLVGGPGNDTIFTGAGNDVVRFHRNADRDLVHDFDIGSDVVDLNVSGVAPWQGPTWADQSGPNTALDFGGGDILILADVAANELQPWHFV